jgi:omega-6 fatty acid desaturase (delta-12 desaturase)
LSLSLLLGFLLPLVIFATVTGASLYLMHTHRNIPWFKGTAARKGDYAPELCATHLTLPRPLSKFVHHVFAHSAHHAHAGVPVYNLLDAQLHLNRLLGNRAVVEPLSLWGALATMNACKLYDYDRHQWLDFDGKPSAPPIRLNARAA